MRRKTITLLLALVTALAFSTALCFADENPHFYVRDQQGNIYQDGATMEIPSGDAAFLIFDSTYEEVDGTAVMPGIRGYISDPLNDAGMATNLGTADMMGFDSFNLGSEFGLRIDTAGVAAGTEVTLAYHLYQQVPWEEFDFINTPTLLPQTLKIKIIEAAAVPQQGVTKATQDLIVTAKAQTVKYSKVRKAKVTVKAISIDGEAGKVTYTRKSGASQLTVNKSTGKITVKKGTKKGTYKIKVQVKTAGNEVYNPASKSVTVKVKVK